MTIPRSWPFQINERRRCTSRHRAFNASLAFLHLHGQSGRLHESHGSVGKERRGHSADLFVDCVDAEPALLLDLPV